MKASNKPLHPKRRIKSLRDLELEKARIQFEILKVEERLKYDYKRIIDFVSLKHAFRMVSHNLSLTGKGFSRGFSMITGLFRRKKKEPVPIFRNHRP